MDKEQHRTAKAQLMAGMQMVTDRQQEYTITMVFSFIDGCQVANSVAGMRW